MADISNLSNLQATEPLDWDGYVDAKEAPPIPPAGRYIVRAPDRFQFGATAQGFLSAQINPRIVGPSNEGYEIRYANVSAKPFKRGAVTVSQLGDYLRSTGSAARPRTPQEQADAVEQTAGAVYPVDADWEAYHGGTKWTKKGMTSFPKAEGGGFDPWVTVPDPADPKQPLLGEDGQPVRIKARFKITRFVPPAGTTN